MLTFVRLRIAGEPLSPKWEPLQLGNIERELSSTRAHTFVCRNKAARFPNPPLPPSPNNNNNNQIKSVVSQGNVVKKAGAGSVASRDVRDRIESSAIHNSVNRSGVVDSGKIFIVNIERGEREGPKHSLMNTPHIDYHTHRSGANKSKVQTQHEVLPGSANAGIALQGYATPRDIRPAKVLRPRGSDLQSRLGTRHYKDSRGENSNSYIPSSSSNRYNSCSPHSNQSTGCSMLNMSGLTSLDVPL